MKDSIVLTGIVLAKNEEENIKGCLDSLRFCGEMIVLDDHSTDKTAEIAKKLNAEVITRKLDYDFAAQRNYGLKRARGKWVFFLDADERVSKELRSEMVNLVNDPLNFTMGFYIKRSDYLFNKELRHGETSSLKLLRLARRKAGKWKRVVHEEWHIVGKTNTLSNPIKHYSHPNLRSFVNNVNVFSSLHAKANRKEGKKASLLRIIFWPPLKFVQNYIFKLGLLDGQRGLLVSLMMSFHSFLAWSKLWLWQKKTLSLKS